MKRTVRIGSRAVGPEEPVFIVAEIGVNHGGDVKRAEALVRAAARCGVDAVKLQNIDPDESYLPGGPSHREFQGTTLGREDLRRLMEVAGEEDVLLGSTPGSPADLETLAAAGIHLVKISSGLMTHIPLLRRAAATGLPLMMSTGMSHLDEVLTSVRAAEESGCDRLMVLHCTSLYPAPAETLNLRAMETLARLLPCPVGYSDHFDGATACVAATALGARILEKHFTLDRTLPGADHRYSADPPAMGRLVEEVRCVERALGASVKAPVPEELPARARYRRCLVARRPIRAGEVVAEDMIGVKRPLEGRRGLDPGRLDEVVGLKARRDVAHNEILSLDMFGG